VRRYVANKWDVGPTYPLAHPLYLRHRPASDTDALNAASTSDHNGAGATNTSMGVPGGLVEEKVSGFIDDSYSPTIGADVQLKLTEVFGNQVRVDVWDIGGADRYPTD